MKRGNILAHRGLWTDPAERNSRAALRGALQHGFGIETDFRDSGGLLWISHDPVPDADIQTAAAFFADCVATGNGGRLALNIKADGLQSMLADAMAAANVPMDQVYAFDMSVPDTLGYIKRAFPIYARLSEYEPEPVFSGDASGVWVDNFTGGFPQVARAAEILDRGQRACIVSPELHGRPHQALWDEIAAKKLHQSPHFELCTDYPKEAHRVLGSD